MNRFERTMYFMDCLHKHTLIYSELHLSSRNMISEEDYNLVLSYAYHDAIKEYTTFLRAIFLLTYLHRASLTEIACTLDISQPTAYRYIRTFKKKGVKGLLFPPKRGRKAYKYSSEYKDKLFSILHAPPCSYGINRTTWRLQDLKKIMNEQGIIMSAANISKAIKEAGYVPRKSRTVLTSNDPNYLEKLKNITSILSNLKPTERFFSIDEYGPRAVKMIGGRSLVKKGHFKAIPQWQDSKGWFIMTAALELSTNQVTHFYSEKKNTDEMIKLLNILIVEYKDVETIYLSWDAASWHVSKKLYARIDEINNSSNNLPTVRVAPLPARAQFLNVIESVFSGMARAIIHNSDYESVDECKHTIDLYFEERNQAFKLNPKRAGNKIWGKERVPPVFTDYNNCKDECYWYTFIEHKK